MSTSPSSQEPAAAASPGWTIPGTTMRRSPSGPSSPGRRTRASPSSCCCISNTGSCMPDEDSHPGPALRRRVRQLHARLPHLDAARVRQPHRHLPRAGRARPLPDPRRRRGQCAGGRALSLPDRAVQEAEVRVHRPRPFGQPHDLLEDERGRGEGRDRRLHRRDREGGRRAAERLARARNTARASARRSSWPMPASTTCSTGRTTTSPTR